MRKGYVIYKDKKDINKELRDDVISDLIFFSIFFILFIWSFLDKEPEIDGRVIVWITFIVIILPVTVSMLIKDIARYNLIKKTLEMKKNGEVIAGELVHVELNKLQLIVRIIDDYGKEKYLVSTFPRDFYENSFFQKIYQDIEIKYNEENELDIKTIEVLNGDGYIKFNINLNKKDKNLIKEKFDEKTYTGSLSHNFEGNITCNVYKYDDKYLVDEYSVIE